MARAQIRLGTRGSALALAQAERVAERIDGAEVVTISSDGQRGDKSRFVRGIERALLAGEVEIGVHSAKDLPSELPAKLEIVAATEREDPADACVGADSLETLAEGAVVGTSSLRRRSQLLALRPDLELRDLHGNVDTRLRRLAEGDFDAIVLAAAGLRRLGREDEIGFRFESAQMTPAPGQGTLALEARRGNGGASKAASTVGDPGAETELRAERAAVGALDASCETPLGVRASTDGSRISIAGYCGLPDGSEWVRDAIEGEPGEAEELGRELARRMLAAGAGELLRRSREPA
jgi:hydroxymethylbilane synthase